MIVYHRCFATLSQKVGGIIKGMWPEGGLIQPENTASILDGRLPVGG